MKIPGITTILIYQLKQTEQIVPNEDIKLFSSSDLTNNRWILKYFPEDICIKRWQEGNKLFYLLNKDNIPCSFAWIKKNRQHFVGELNKILVFPVVMNCIFDCVTPEEYRGNGHYPTLIKRLSILESKYPSIIYASSFNVPSGRGILKSGFKLTHKIFRIFNFVKITKLDNSGINFNARKVD